MAERRIPVHATGVDSRSATSAPREQQDRACVLGAQVVEVAGRWLPGEAVEQALPRLVMGVSLCRVRSTADAVEWPAAQNANPGPRGPPAPANLPRSTSAAGGSPSASSARPLAKRSITIVPPSENDFVGLVGHRSLEGMGRLTDPPVVTSLCACTTETQFHPVQLTAGSVIRRHALFRVVRRDAKRIQITQVSCAFALMSRQRSSH